MPPKTFKRQPVVPPAQKSKDKEDSLVDESHKSEERTL